MKGTAKEQYLGGISCFMLAIFFHLLNFYKAISICLRLLRAMRRNCHTIPTEVKYTQKVRHLSREKQTLILKTHHPLEHRFYQRGHLKCLA